MRFYNHIRSAYWLATGNPATHIGRSLARSQYWDRSELLAYRDAKARDLVSHCYENVPYYSRLIRERGLHPRDFRSAADLRKLPLLTKTDLRTHAKDLLARNFPTKNISWSTTGGTTGEPIRVAKDRACIAWEVLCYERGLAWGGVQLHVPRILLFGGSLGIDRTRWTARFAQMLRKDLFLPAFELRADTAHGFFDAIRRSGLRHVVGYASALYRLAVLAEEYAPDIRFKAVFPTAELLLPEWAEVIRRGFECEVLPFYGCGEVNSLGYCLPNSDSYVIPEENCIIEVARDRGGDSESIGDGMFVITSLVNYAMPIIRYVNGDAGGIGPVSESFPFSRIVRLHGRYNSLLMTDSGDYISGVLGTHVFRHLTTAVETYRIIQKEPLRVVIKVVPRGESLSSKDEDLIRNLFVKYLGSRMRVSVETVTSIPAMPSGKSMFVINELLS
jgi:phenylacetate-coenzyme A ligase PaaK-like adenylate-forming protein